ncbi:hypothetical protein A5N75_08200 [Prescottella equi]|nr:hypothetical protein A5N75_08200 [Prescottella equi]
MSVVEDIRAIRGSLERIEAALCGQRVTRFDAVEVPAVESVRPLRLVEGVAADVDSPIELFPVEVEPEKYGLYEDKDGEQWSKSPAGWTFTSIDAQTNWDFASSWAPFTYAGGERNELANPKQYSLSEVVTILHSEGIDTGQRRLKQYLNTGICWTDGFNNPRECATDFLVVVKKSSPGRDAVVRVTAAGVAKLVELMGAK